MKYLRSLTCRSLSFLFHFAFNRLLSRDYTTKELGTGSSRFFCSVKGLKNVHSVKLSKRSLMMTNQNFSYFIQIAYPHTLRNVVRLFSWRLYFNSRKWRNSVQPPRLEKTPTFYNNVRCCIFKKSIPIFSSHRTSNSSLNIHLCVETEIQGKPWKISKILHGRNSRLGTFLQKGISIPGKTANCPKP